jgi:hypothetical protein
MVHCPRIHQGQLPIRYLYPSTHNLETNQSERDTHMKVLVVFEFDGVEDPNSPEADAKVRAIAESCETMQVAFDANACWVQEVFGEDKND